MSKDSLLKPCYGIEIFLISICMKINLKSHITYVNIICILSIAISILFTFGFLHGRVLFKWDAYVLNTEIAGHYGDFIGGAIGTLVSIVLLYYTLKLQRRDSENNVQVYKQQQLNDLFFHLLKQYDDILKSLKTKTSDNKKLQGREALHFILIEMYEQFEVKENDSQNRKHAVSSFLNFYSLSRDFSPIYFRTLFRVFKLLETSDKCLRVHSIQLMKILRAQLSDSELALLRYNGMSRQGSKFVPLINKFNLLKHLPPLELMEYKMWSKKMTLEERGCTNVLLLETKHNIQKVLETSASTASYSNNPRKYIINVSSNDEATELKVYLYINKNVILNDSDLIRGVCKLAEDERLSLLLFFVKDCLVLSSFNKLNIYKDLEFDSKKDEDAKLLVTVKTKNHVPLRMRDTDDWA